MSAGRYDWDACGRAAWPGADDRDSAAADPFSAVTLIEEQVPCKADQIDDQAGYCSEHGIMNDPADADGDLTEKDLFPVVDLIGYEKQQHCDAADELCRYIHV